MAGEWRGSSVKRESRKVGSAVAVQTAVLGSVRGFGVWHTRRRRRGRATSRPLPARVRAPCRAPTLKGSEC